MLTRDERRVAASRSAHSPCRSPTIRCHLGGVDVVAEHGPLEPLAGSRGSAARAAGGAALAAPANEIRSPAAAAGAAAVERLELQQRRLGGDVDVRGRPAPADAAAERCDERGLHLHALDDGDDVAGLDLVARRDRDRRRRRPARGCGPARRRRGRCDAGRRRPRRAGRRPARRSACGRWRRRPPAAARSAPTRRTPTSTVTPSIVTRWRRGPIWLTAQRYACPRWRSSTVRAVRGVGLRPAAAGERVEARAVGGRLGLADLDRRLQDRHVGVAHRRRCRPAAAGGPARSCRRRRSAARAGRAARAGSPGWSCRPR